MVNRIIKEIKVALDNAVNTDTGKLSLHKFAKEIKSAGLDMKTLH